MDYVEMFYPDIVDGGVINQKKKQEALGDIADEELIIDSLNQRRKQIAEKNAPLLIAEYLNGATKTQLKEKYSNCINELIDINKRLKELE